MKYILYVNCNDRVVEYSLPAITNRKCSVNIAEIDPDCYLELEMFDDVWRVFSSYQLTFIGEASANESITLSDETIIRAVYNNMEMVLIFRKLTSDYTDFKKYDISNVRSIAVGSDDDCDIVFDDPYISGKHAYISKIGDAVYITDNSTNGTFLNGQLISSNTLLNIFDEIYTVGFKMVFLGDIIAVNNSSKVSCKLAAADLDKFTQQEKSTDIRSEYYSATPRRIYGNNNADIVISSPPPKGKRNEQPLIFLLGPTLTMPMPVLIYSLMDLTNKGTFSINNLVVAGANVMVTAAVGLMWAIAQRKHDKASFLKNEEQRIAQYESYLKKIILHLSDRHVVFKNNMLADYLSADEYVRDLSSVIWNRYKNEQDFLKIRIGRGAIVYPGTISVSAERFSAKNDILEEKAALVYQNFRYIDNAVTLVDIKSNSIIGVVGSQQSVCNIGTNMLMQISALHNYSDVKIAMISDNKNINNYKWCRWLPHIFTNDKSCRLICDETTGSQNVLFYLSEMLRSRKEHSVSDKDPHYVIFCTSPNMIANEIIEKFIYEPANIGVTLVLLYGDEHLIPHTCNLIIKDIPEYKGLLYRDKTVSPTDTTVFDNITTVDAEKFARRISGLKTRINENSEIPSTVDYFKELGISNIHQWDLIKKYKENRVYEHIRGFIGITAENRHLYLDIHEKKFGPHGLVAGTTGSGKSEFLQTYILSLALNYSPSEVSFLLIDYKGGGMANNFASLPHIAGIITNLSDRTGEYSYSGDNQTKRALIAIKSEIKRRQTIFNSNNISHIDNYIKLYRSRNDLTALPHLIIISDEFAELKKNNPDFIRELVSAARIGRSLGIHLILATQKPAGVIDDEIWSNARFKICLRVQDKQDSMEMLKRPDAASLTQTGRAYLQVGNDELFDTFQSAYSGCKYIHRQTETFEFSDDMGIIELDAANILVRKSKESRTDKESQMSVAVKYIKEICEANNIAPAKKLWLSPLPNTVYYDDVIEEQRIDFSRSVTAVFGLVDNMEKQKRYPAHIDLRKCSNLFICGVNTSDRADILQTMMYSLCVDYTPDEVQFYAIDCSSRSLKIFGTAPHCGCVALYEDSTAIKEIIRKIESMIVHRRSLFNEKNVSDYNEYILIESMPLTIIFIDDYEAFTESYTNESDKLSKIMRSGPACGIRVVIASSHTSDVRFRVKQNISDFIALRLNDKSEYYELFDKKPKVIPENIKGRGIIEQNDELLEFQTAQILQVVSPAQKYSEMLEKLKNNIMCSPNNTEAEKICNIPSGESFEEFYEKYHYKGFIPLGYDVDSAISVGLKISDTHCFGVYSDANKNKAVLSFIKGKLTEENIKCFRIAQNECTPEKVFGLFSEFTNESTGNISNQASAAVIIDDLESFLSAVYSSNNRQKLYETIEKMFKDKNCKIMFFAGITPYADAMIDRSDISFTNAFRNFIADNHGLLIDIPVSEQNVFKYTENYSCSKNYCVYFNGDISKEIYIPGENDNER